jgi:hypothetical protein
MASPKNAPPEPLTTRLARQTAEHQDIITTQTDAVLRDIAAADAALVEHAKRDNPDGIAQVNEQITVLHARRVALTTAATHKATAIAETTKQIAMERRAAAVAKFQALVQQAAPLVKALDAARYALVDAVQRLHTNRSASYAALNGYSHDQDAFASVSSMMGLYGDLEFALKASLSIPQEAGPTRGDAVMQQEMVTQLAESIR